MKYQQEKILGKHLKVTQLTGNNYLIVSASSVDDPCRQAGADNAAGITVLTYTAGEATGITNALIAKSTGIQSQLLTIRAIFYIGAIVTAAAFVLLIIFAMVNKIKAGRTRVVATA